MTTLDNSPEKLKISCPGCGQNLDVTGIAAFSEIQCPKCQFDIKVPRRFAHFLLEDVVEHGPVASVYRALDLKLDREVAVKIFDPEIGTTPESLETFQEITRQAAALNHPNIIPIYSSGEHEGHPYLNMEFMDRTGLRRTVAADGSMPVKAALEVLENAARGLDAARSDGVLHGGLHPRNILVNSEAETKVSDFQMHRLIGHKLENLETYGTACRTDPRYASPEMLKHGEQDCRGDIFSLGLILAFMLGANHPFDADTPPEARTIDWARIDATAKHPVPAAVRALIESMTAPNASERIQSYRAVIAKIESLRESTHYVTVKPAGTNAPPQGGKRSFKRNGTMDGSLLRRNSRRAKRRKWTRRVLGLLLLAATVAGAWNLHNASIQRPAWYVDHVEPNIWKIRRAFGLDNDRSANEDTPATASPPPPATASPPPPATNPRQETEDEPQPHTHMNERGASGTTSSAADESSDALPVLADAPAQSPQSGNDDLPTPSLSDRPQPVDLDFFAVQRQILDYVDRQPESIREIEKERLRRISGIRDYLQSMLQHMPYVPKDGNIDLKNGRRIRGIIPFCNDHELTIRLDRRNAKFSSVSWKEISIEQYQEMLVFYAEKRMENHDVPSHLTVRKTPKTDAANDYLLAALLAEWYGNTGDAAAYAKKALAIDPELSGQVRRLFHHLLR